MFESGIDDFGETFAVFADHVHAGLNPGSLSGGQQSRSFGSVLRIGLVKRVQEQQITEMKNARAAVLKVQIRSGPERISAAGVEERAPPVALLGHHIRG